MYDKNHIFIIVTIHLESTHKTINSSVIWHFVFQLNAHIQSISTDLKIGTTGLFLKHVSVF